MELRDTVAAIIERELADVENPRDCSPLIASRSADRILAIPEIAEALELKAREQTAAVYSQVIAEIYPASKADSSPPQPL